LCQPSNQEGLPLSILEAWAAGKPVVATDVIGINDLVVHGDSGLLVPPDDPRGLAGAIGTLLGNHGLQQHLAENGRRLVAEQYALPAMVTQYADFYQRLVGGDRCAR
jgi:glycosyltransferase involved in cell wall biosynthesis